MGFTNFNDKYSAIPQELKDYKNWVCWQAYPDPKSHSGISKKPVNPKTGGPRGSMCTGFVAVNGQTYYCRPKAEAGYPEGSMVTGKKMIDGKEYYFEADGRMKK